MAETSLVDLGWQPFFETQVSQQEAESYLIARVIAHYGSHILFMSTESEFSVPTAIVETDDDGLPRSSLGISSVAVGDWMLLERKDFRVFRRLQRTTLLSRKAAGAMVRAQLIAANIDTVLIVSSCNQDFNLSRLERYLALVLESGAYPVVVLTKADQAADSAQLRRQVERLRSGLIVETLDARDPEQTSALHPWCGIGKTVSLLGSSGVGKSTLANALGGHKILTAAAREDDDKGRHTTTARSMHRLTEGGWLIDSPGMRELQLADCEDGVADVFADIVSLANHCKFRNCTHQGDAGCAVEAAIADGTLEYRRLRSFLKLRSEQARNSTSLAERREKERKTGQMYKNIISEKRNRRGN